MKTDTQLQQDVTAELRWDASVHAAQIGVEVKDGVVTLSGEVSSYMEKLNAENAAQRVSGVKALAVDLHVKLGEFGLRTDADIARSAENVLEWTVYSATDPIKVKVEKGWITLTGSVSWQYQRQAAIDNVRGLLGVTGVSNEIAIKPKVSMGAVKADIESALTRRATADARKIGVKVTGSDITLTGTVANWSERELATRAAWSTPGVRNVYDELTLA